VKKCELLAPAGNAESLRAAIENGADAVYLAGKRFGARKSSLNFDLPELAEAINYAHRRRVRLYVTVNTLVADSEKKDLLDWLKAIDHLEVDAAIVQDLGVLKLAQEYVPDLPLHASTQMTVLDAAGAKKAFEWGMTRAILARELSLEEIALVHSLVPRLELESFCHGALCYGLSGQCLFSSLLGGRSGNRGECAQPCRHPYEMRWLEGDLEKLERKAFGHPFSLKDLNTLAVLPKLVESGIAAVKIEGRLKRPEYVAIAVRAYRMALDGDPLPPGMDRDLSQLFNRGFSTGHLFDASDKEDLVSFEQPGHRGLEIGKVKKFSPKTGRIVLDLMDSFTPQAQDELQIGEKRFTAEKVDKNSVISWSLKDQEIMIGSPVIRLSEEPLLAKLRSSYEKEKKIPLKVEARAELDLPLVLFFSDEEGHRVRVETEKVLEIARNQPLDRERLFAQLDRMGDSIFSLAEASIDRTDLAVSPSSLNAARREAVEKLEEQRKRHYSRPKAGVDLSEKKVGIELPGGLIAHVRGLACLNAALEGGVDGLVIDSDDPEGRPMAAQCLRADRFFFLRLSPFGNEKKEVFSEWGSVGVLAANLGQIDAPLVSDYSLSLFNRDAAQFLFEKGVSRAALSVELNKHQIAEIAKNSPLPLEAIVHGRYPLLLGRHCAGKRFCQEKKCLDHLQIFDRLNLEIPLQRDSSCRIALYNPKELCLIDRLAFLKKAGIDSFRLELTLDGAGKVFEVCSIYRNVLDRGEASEPEKKKLAALSDQGLTGGHWDRGVL
jgi:putative protease